MAGARRNFPLPAGEKPVSAPAKRLVNSEYPLCIKDLDTVWPSRRQRNFVRFGSGKTCLAGEFGGPGYWVVCFALDWFISIIDIKAFNI
jgi:hypothetical protein